MSLIFLTLGIFLMFREEYILGAIFMILSFNI